MKITVVTVCRNAADVIKDTVCSVLSQDMNKLEYIIIDGASTDNTVDIIKSIPGSEQIMIISEGDKGLYDAMNKGVAKATGDYIIFMNAGDVFYDNDVINDVCASLDADIVYGDTVRVWPNGPITEKYSGAYKELRLFLMGRMMCHQSMFTKRSVLLEHPFDLSYKITADYNFAVKVYKKGYKYKHIDRIVSKFDCLSGVSSDTDNNDAMRAEDDRTLKEFYPILYFLIYLPKLAVRTIKRKKERKAK